MSDDNKNKKVKNPSEVKSLQKKLEDAEIKIKENMDGWQRARADYANLQKQHTAQMENLKSYIVFGFVEDLLPVLDSFAMAMGNTKVWEKVDKNWRLGIEYILKQFNDTLEKYEVKEIECVPGDNFNPELHQAMEKIETNDEKKDNVIESIMQKGYKIKNDVIRPVKVKTFEYIKNN